MALGHSTLAPRQACREDTPSPSLQRQALGDGIWGGGRRAPLWPGHKAAAPPGGEGGVSRALGLWLQPGWRVASPAGDVSALTHTWSAVLVPTGAPQQWLPPPALPSGKGAKPKGRQSGKQGAPLFLRHWKRRHRVCLPRGLRDTRGRLALGQMPASAAHRVERSQAREEVLGQPRRGYAPRGR